MRVGYRIAVMAAALGWSVAQPMGEAVARVQQAPSSRVTLDLPEGYTPADQFSGFVNSTHRVSLVVLEMPGAAFEQVAQGMTAEALASKGLRNGRAIALEREGPSLYMQAEQASANVNYAKFLLLFREEGVTALITANVEKDVLERGTVSVTDVERIMASARIAPAPAAARDVFTLDYLGPFKAAGSILGTTRIYTLDGRMEPAGQGARRATLIVAPSLDRRFVTEPMAYSETLLTSLPGIAAPLIAERREMQLAGREAIEIVATAKDTDGGTQIALYQVLILGPAGGYMRLVGQAPIADRDTLLPEFRKIARGLRPLE